MAKLAVKDIAKVAVGVMDHGGWGIFVTAKPDGTLIDRRRVELVEEGLPAMPHHCEGQRMGIDEAVQLVEEVRASAEECAALALDELSSALPRDVNLAAIALRECPPLPETTAERIQDYFSRNNADWVMYRQALAKAALARGWIVHWYDAKHIIDDAARALRLDLEETNTLLNNIRATMGPPWQKDHRTAMAASIVSAAALRSIKKKKTKKKSVHRTRR